MIAQEFAQKCKKRAIAALSAVTPSTIVSADDTLYKCERNVEIFGVEAGATYGVAPAPTVSCTDSWGAWTLAEGTDYAVEYYGADGVKLDAAPSAKGSYFMKLVGNSKTCWGESESIAFSIDPDISEATVSFSDDASFIYTGEPQAPEASVEYKGKTLTEDAEYEVVYSNAYGTYESTTAPALPGYYTATVRTKAPYEGGVLASKGFTIGAINLANAAVSVPNCVYTGEEVGPEVKVTLSDGSALSDAIVSTHTTFKNAAGEAVAAPTEVGSYTAVVSGEGLYGSVEAQFQIVDADKVLESVASCTNEAELVYTGEALTPVFVLTDQGGNPVAAAQVVSYTKDGEAVSSVVEVGTYTATVTAEGYAGSATCEFAVAAKEVEASVELVRDTYEYIPTAYWMSPTTPVPSGTAAEYRSEYVDPELKVTVGDKTLVAGTDYKVVYADGVVNALSSKADAASVEVPFSVELMGSYSGTVTGDNLKFTIKKGQNTYSYKGVKFRYAIEADGTATITGLDMNIDENTTDFSAAYEAGYDGVLTIPGKIEAGGKTYQVKRIAARAFALPSAGSNSGATVARDLTNGATKLVVEDGIEELCQDSLSGVFASGSKVSEMVLSSTLKTVWYGALRGVLAKVKNISVPASVELMSRGAFGQNIDSSVVETLDFGEGSKIQIVGADHELAGVGTTWTASGDVQYQSGKYIPGFAGEIDGGTGRPETETSVNSPMKELVVPASLVDFSVGGMVPIVKDFKHLSDLYFMGRYTTGEGYSTTSMKLGQYGACYGSTHNANWDGATRLTIWGWDVDGSVYAAACKDADASNYVSGFEPFAVIGKQGGSFAYGDESYAVNVALGDVKATVTGTDVSVDWDLQYSWANATERKLVEGADFTVELKDSEGNVIDKITGPGTYAATLTGNGKTCFGTAEATVKVEVPAGNVIDESCVTLSETSYTVDGTAKEPAVTVKVGGEVLEQGTDYTVSYRNNVKVGTATVTVKGIGMYAGTAICDFEIARDAARDAQELEEAKQAAVDAAAVEAAKAACAEAGIAYDDSKSAADNAAAAKQAQKAAADKAAAEQAQKAAADAVEQAAKDACDVAGIKYDSAKTPAENTAAATKAVAEAAATKAAQEAAQTAVEQSAKDACDAAGIDYDASKTPAQNVAAATAAVKAAAAAAAKASEKAQSLSINTAAKTMKCSKGKKKLTKAKKTATVKVAGAKGKLAYKKLKGSSSKLSLVKTSKGFKVKVKKGTKKGTYKVKIRVSAAAAAGYKATSTTVTISVIVK